MIIASWNLEKNGQSSSLEKQSKVSDFIHQLCASDGLGADVLFLCEVHSARSLDYISFLQQVYPDYTIHTVHGGYSNDYVIMFRTNQTIQWIQDIPLRYLNRSLSIFSLQGTYVGFAHFKSGQTNLTKSQIEWAALILEHNSTSNWLITGDMNWDYSRYNQLAMPAGAHAYSYWQDCTQRKGGILDWCIAGKNTQVSGFDLANPMKWNPAYSDMSGPDHKPVVYQAD